MPFIPNHYGLTFSIDQIENARNQQESEQAKPVWDYFSSATGTDATSQAHLDALRYRINGDETSASYALEQLVRDINISDEPSLLAIRRIFADAHIFEMLRDYAPLADIQVQWLSNFTKQVEQLNALTEELSALEKLWLMTLNTATGVILEDENYFNQGIAYFKHTINEDIHPEGYIRSTLGIADGETVARQVLSVGALVMTAEIATQAGEDLWQYQDRGVGVGTPAQYLIYYYFYPEKWNWEQGFDLDYMQTLYKKYAAFLGIVDYRLQSRGIDDLLAEQSPMFDAYGGGLTSLTHIKMPQIRRRLWGLFG